MKSRPSKSASSSKKAPKREDPAAPKSSFPIVAIGASAGGLDAYKELLLALPSDTGMAFVLIQHLDPSHHSMLTEIVAKATKMPVEEVRSRAAVQPDHVYVIPPNKLLALENGIFQLSSRGKAPAQHLAIDFFMRSLAREEKSRAIGIVLSGTGADGTLGLEEIKAEGGITFAQDPATAKYDGMPRSAIDSGCVDFVLSPNDIAKEIRHIQQHPYITMADEESSPRSQNRDLGHPNGDAEASPRSQSPDLGLPNGENFAAPSSQAKDFAAILARLHKASGADFSQYRPSTIHRRLLRRIVVLKLDSLHEYAGYLKEHPEEAEKLFDDVLIPVTSFFRDFEAFEALKAKVYPAIVKDKRNKGAIRMWAPGCSTGEETYSLAMTLLEFLGDRASSFQVQIFGTDLNYKSIQKARIGVYRESITEEISPERIKRFFVKVEAGYRVTKAVRDMCIFARQNLAADPPFSQMNLIACRNLLIYIQPVLQRKILPILHYALKPSGFLVLGSSESATSFPNLFSVLDKKHKIYAKKAVPSRLHYDFVQSYSAQRALDTPSGTAKPQPALSGELEVQTEADRIVLREHAPVGVVINREMDVVQFRGHTAPYLEPAPGKPSLNLLKLARNGLAIDLRILIALAAKKGIPVRKDSVPFEGDGHKRMLDLSVTPLSGAGQEERGQGGTGFFLVLFEDVTPRWIPPVVETGSPGKTKAGLAERHEAKHLKQELARAQDALRFAVESENTLKEEFQSANEEILSTNEELQSTNEELQTSKEELQSANEELNTLNAELHTKNNDLQELSNDVLNLLNSTRIPVVMLDRHLSIRRITPAATRLFKVLPSDVGRPFADIKLNIEASDLTPSEMEDAMNKVLESLQPVEREVRDPKGHWHGLSILPYRTQENKIDGVVLALQDIDAVKSAGLQLQRSFIFFRGVTDTMREPLLVLDHELRVVTANESFLRTFKVSPEQTIGRLLYDLGNGQWKIPALRRLLERVLLKAEAVTDFEVDHDFEEIGERKMLLNARTLEQPVPAQPMILLAIEDITERSKADAALRRSEAAAVELMKEAVGARQAAEDLNLELRESEARYRDLLNALPIAVYTTDANGTITLFNEAAKAFAGRHPRVGKDRWCISHRLYRPDGSPLPHEEYPMAVMLRTGRPQRGVEVIAERPDGTRAWIVPNLFPIRNTFGEVTGGINVLVDITERKLAEAALIKSEKLAAAGRLAAALAHEINNPLQAITNLVSLWKQSSVLDLQSQGYAAMTEAELRRVTQMTQQSLSFYREPAATTTIRIEEAIEGILAIYYKRVQAKAIRVLKEFPPDALAIQGRAGEFRQIFTTVLLNAIEAVDVGGIIAIRARKSSNGSGPGSSGVRITICDNGAGIPASDIARIFDPFFTTKGENGTGLGLWVASGIISRLGGSIAVRSNARADKHGTCFSIFLPSRPPERS